MHLLSWTNRYLYFKITINVDEQPLQARHQEFFRAGKVFQNKGTSINFLSATQERKAPQGKISEIFFLDTLKTAF